MPIIQIHLMEGRSDDLKRNLVREVTKSVCETLNVQPKNVRIILSEMPKNGYAIAGTLIQDADNPFG